MDKLREFETKVVTDKNIRMGSLIVAALTAIYGVLTLIEFGEYGIATFITLLLSAFVYVFVSRCVNSRQNDTGAKIAIIAYTLFNTIPGIITIVLMLCIKFIKNDTVRGYIKKAWFVPGVYSLIATLTGIGAIFAYFSVFTAILGLLASLGATVMAFIVGYWGLHILNIMSAGEKKSANQRAYYADLYKQGVLSAEEYAAKIAEIDGN